MAFLTKKEATAVTPQVVTLIVDDSGSMQGPQKAGVVTGAMQDLVMQLQSDNLGSSGFRFLLNIAKFGDHMGSLAVAVSPKEVDLNKLSFAGSSGQTNMPEALRWAAEATRQALERCRKVTNYREEDAPSPICIFFSDGANTEGTISDIEAAAVELKAISFTNGNVDVVACGIGMEPADFPIMEKIATRSDLAANIPSSKLRDFIANVGATILAGGSPNQITQGPQSAAASR